MTVEHIHDALTLLPADLVAEADKRRSRKTKIIPWHRWAAAAACLVLITGCTLLIQSWKPGKTQSNVSLMAAPAAVAEDAPGEASGDSAEAAPAEAWDAANDSVTAGTGSRHSSAMMDQGAFPAGIADIQWVETPVDGGFASPEVFLIQDAQTLEGYLEDCKDDNLAGLGEATARYEESWFDTHDLLLIRLTCPSGTTVGGIQEDAGLWNIILRPSRLSLRNSYHILMDVEKGCIESANQVNIAYTEP